MAKYFFFIFKATKYFRSLVNISYPNVLLKSKSIRSTPNYKDAKGML